MGPGYIAPAWEYMKSTVCTVLNGNLDETGYITVHIKQRVGGVSGWMACWGPALHLAYSLKAMYLLKTMGCEMWLKALKASKWTFSFGICYTYSSQKSRINFHA